MLRRTLGGMLLLMWLLSPIVYGAERDPLVADVPRGKWWKMPRLAEELKLADEEKDKLDDLFLNYRRKVIDIKNVMERGWLELDNLLEKESLDEAAAMEEFAKVKTARSDLATEGFRFLLEVRKILGPERYQRLKASFKQIRKKMMRKRYDESSMAGSRSQGPLVGG